MRQQPCSALQNATPCTEIANDMIMYNGHGVVSNVDATKVTIFVSAVLGTANHTAFDEQCVTDAVCGVPTLTCMWGAYPNLYVGRLPSLHVWC